MANPILSNGVASLQSIYEVHQPGGLVGVNGGHHKVGTRATLGDRTFFYASHSLSTTLTKAMIYGNAAVVANDQNRTWAGTAGQTQITLTSGGTVAVNAYNEGWFLADSGGGLGQYFKIKTNTADVANVVTINLYDPLVVTASATPTGSLQKNMFADVVVFPGNSQAAVAIGVPQVTVPAGDTNNQFFWMQTSGPAALSCEGSVTIGMAIVPATAATSDAGQGKAVVETGTTADTGHLIGRVLIANGTDEHHALVDLCIRG